MERQRREEWVLKGGGWVCVVFEGEEKKERRKGRKILLLLSFLNQFLFILLLFFFLLLRLIFLFLFRFLFLFPSFTHSLSLSSCVINILIRKKEGDDLMNHHQLFHPHPISLSHIQKNKSIQHNQSSPYPFDSSVNVYFRYLHGFL
jgi:hypothetical protein